MSDVYQSLAHSKWDCKYHVVIVEGHLMPDHVHMCIAIPPKHPVASVIGFLKGKSAIAIARLSGKERNFSGETLLGSRLRGVHGRVRTGASTPIHPRAGCRGW